MTVHDQGRMDWEERIMTDKTTPRSTVMTERTAADVTSAPALGYSPAGNGIRTGAQYLAGLRDGREVWTRG